jgi:hypothetical protein
MNEERIAEVYDELGKLIVELDPDPVARGPAYLQDLISKVRGYLNHVSVYVQEVHRERHDLERHRDGLQAAFDVEADRLLSEDKRVNRQPSIDDRKAMINLLLTDEKREIQAVERELRSLGHVEKAVRHRQKELESTMSAIRLQRGLIQDEIRTGSFYGDETETSRGDAWKKKPEEADPVDEELGEEELGDLIAEAEKQLEAEAKGEAPEEAPEEADKPFEASPDVTKPGHGQDPMDPTQGWDEAPAPAPAAEVSPEAQDIENFLNEDDDDFDGLFDELGDDSPSPPV